MSKILGLVATLAAIIGLTAAPSSAATPQDLSYYGPGGAFLHSAQPTSTGQVVAFGTETKNPATISTLTPGVCTLGPVIAPGVRNVTFINGGVCQLRFQVAGGAGPGGYVYDPIDSTRAIHVFKFPF